jgi:hypothetical protein
LLEEQKEILEEEKEFKEEPIAADTAVEKEVVEDEKEIIAEDLGKEIIEQEKEIERERAKIKYNDSYLDLNQSSIKTFSNFGGQTTSQRESVAKERVSLMESERDLMEAIAYAKTKEEKEALRKELNEIKALRRDLETALR